jgi:hypothetical protein
MTKRIYLSLPLHIREQLILGDIERQRIGLYVPGGPIDVKKEKARLASFGKRWKGEKKFEVAF